MFTTPALVRNDLSQGQRAQMGTMFRETLTALEARRAKLKADAKAEAKADGSVKFTEPTVARKTQSGRTVQAAVPDHMQPRLNTDLAQAKAEG